MQAQTMTQHSDWEGELAAFLTDLTAVQQELLELLASKRERLARADLEGLARLAEREHGLAARLETCHQRRAELLRKAKAQGLPGDSLQAAQASLPEPRAELGASMRQAASRARLLEHQSLTNWVLTQRTLLYLSQLLELIGTGGRSRPTYSKSEPRDATGALMDRAA
jgi:hypothetical protein